MTSVPPPQNQALVDALQELSKQLGLSSRNERIGTKVRRENAESFKNLVNSIRTQYNVTNKLTESVQALDRNNLKALATGTTYNRFLQANTESLKDLRAGFRETVEVQLSNFAAGIRVNSDELNDLNQELLLTGQNTKALEGVNSQLLAITGKDVRAVSTAAKVNREVSEKYLISNDRLVDTLNSLADQLDQASFFGTQAVEAITRVGQELQGVVGVGMSSQIQTVLSLLQPSIENISTQVLAGAENLPQKLAEGTLQTEDLKPLFNRIIQLNEDALASNDPRVAGSVAAAQAGMSERQFRATLQLARNFEKQIEVQDEMRRKQEEAEESIRTARKKANDFFDNLAPSIYNAIVPITPAILQLATALNVGGAVGALSTAGGLGRGRGLIPKLGRGLARNSGSLALGGFGLMSALQGDITGGTIGGATAGAMVGGPVGALVGGAIGFGTAMIATAVNTEKTAEELEAEREAKERERRKREAENAKQVDQLSFMAQYLRRNMDETRISDPKHREISTMLLREMKAMRQAMQDKKNNPSVNPNN